MARPLPYHSSPGQPAARPGSPTPRVPPPPQPEPADRPSTLVLLFPTALAGLAFVVAVGTLAYVLVRGDSKKPDAGETRPDPFGPPLAGYDFSTPKEALKSKARMDARI